MAVSGIIPHRVTTQNSQMKTTLIASEEHTLLHLKSCMTTLDIKCAIVKCLQLQGVRGRLCYSSYWDGGI